VVGQTVQYFGVVADSYPLDEALQDILIINRLYLPSCSGDLVQFDKDAVLLRQQLGLGHFPVLLVNHQSRIVHLDRQALQNLEVEVKVLVVLGVRRHERLQEGLQQLLRTR
jgi:hypothetical protein